MNTPVHPGVFRRYLAPAALALVLTVLTVAPGRAAVIASNMGGNDLWDGMTVSPDFLLGIVTADQGTGLHRDITLSENDGRYDFWRSTDNPQETPIPSLVLELLYNAETGTDNWANFHSETNGYFGWAQFDLDPANQTLTVLAFAYDNTGAQLSLPDAVNAVNNLPIPEPATGLLVAAGLLLVVARRRKRSQSTIPDKTSPSVPCR